MPSGALKRNMPAEIWNINRWSSEDRRGKRVFWAIDCKSDESSMGFALSLY